MSLVEADYAYMTARLLELAARHCGGRLVSSLEGGYKPERPGRAAWSPTCGCWPASEGP